MSINKITSDATALERILFILLECERSSWIMAYSLFPDSVFIFLSSLFLFGCAFLNMAKTFRRISASAAIFHAYVAVLKSWYYLLVKLAQKALISYLAADAAHYATILIPVFFCKRLGRL